MSSGWPLRQPTRCAPGHAAWSTWCWRTSSRAAALDLRFLVLELCQPLEHLKAEYERVLCVHRPRPGCSPFALDHQKAITGFLLAESLANLAGVYRAFGFAQGNKLPLRTDHIAYELEFMNWLISQRRLVSRMALFDRQAAEQATRCDLAQRSFFSDHLAGWAGPLSAGLQKYTGGGYLETPGPIPGGLDSPGTSLSQC